jgi:hypothetical protein
MIAIWISAAYFWWVCYKFHQDYRFSLSGVSKIAGQIAWSLLSIGLLYSFSQIISNHLTTNNWLFNLVIASPFNFLLVATPKSVLEQQQCHWNLMVSHDQWYICSWRNVIWGNKFANKIPTQISLSYSLNSLEMSSDGQKCGMNWF